MTDAAIHIQTSIDGKSTKGRIGKTTIDAPNVAKEIEAKRSERVLISAFQVACIAAAAKTKENRANVMTGLRIIIILRMGFQDQCRSILDRDQRRLHHYRPTPSVHGVQA